MSQQPTYHNKMRYNKIRTDKHRDSNIILHVPNNRYKPSNVCYKPSTGPKIAVASIARNEERRGTLKRFLNCCQKLELYHKDLIYIFIEGDSSDRTYEVLKDWIGKRKGSILIKINKGYSPFYRNKSSKRTIHLAELRNKLIELVLSMPTITEILIIDANYGWKGDLITSLRKTGADIAAPLVVSHKDKKGRRLFYDTWAFRKDGKCFSTFYPYVQGLEVEEPTDIDSVGGGYLIKKDVLEAGIVYNGDTDCEHVSFCRHAREKGFTIKINPKVYIRKGGYND